MSQTDPDPSVSLSIEAFLDERAVRLEHLDAIVDAVADVQQPIVRQIGAVHRVPELLRGRRLRIVSAAGRRRRACCRRRPSAACTCRCRRRTRSRGDCRSRRRRTVRWSLWSTKIFAGSRRFSRSLLPLLERGFPICIRNFPSLRELQHHVVVERLHAADLTLVLLAVLPRGGLSAPGAGCRAVRAAAVAADPDVAFVVDRDAVVRVRPVVALTGTAPMAHEIAGADRTPEPAAPARSTARSADWSWRAPRPARASRRDG